MKIYRDITDNNGVVTSTIEILDIMEGTYSGTDMGERSITATIEYETPIDFKAGDYVEFNIADLVRQSNVEGGNIYERFYLYTMPTIEKTSSPFSARDAFKHTLTFYPRQYELGCTQMRDLIQDNGNNVLYTGWDEFSFYGGAKLLMDRIIAVLHERFGTKGVAGIDYWDYKIADEVNEEKNTALEKFQFDFSANSVMDALLKLNEEEGINTKFFINSRMIYVGYKRPYIVGVDDNNIIKTIPFNFQYGKTSHLPLSVNNGGLYSITKSTGQATPITRLYAYGSDKNLHRFYCSDRIKSGRYVNRLMLPSFGDDGVTDYIESEEGIAKFGIREGSKTFDEIYPSLRYFTYGDLREIKYVIKLMGCGIESDDDNVYDAAQEHKYPIARVQCYKVVEGSNGVNTLVKSAPPVDLAIFLHATGKVVKCTLYANKDGKSSIQRQIAADGTWGNGNGRIPANSLQGSDYIVGSCFAIHDSGYADNNTTITSRNDWFRNTDNITGSNGDGELTEEQKKLVNEIEIHQINYTDTSCITDIYEFEEYEQTHFSRHGYSAYCYPRINKKYPNSQSDSIDVNEVVEVGSVIIEDTELNISEGKNQATYEIYLKDIGFKINEQNWFGEYVFLIDTVKVNFLDGNLGGYSFDVLKETDASELAENIVPAHLPNGDKNPAFFDNAQDTVQATRAYEKGAFWRIVLKRCDTEINNYWMPNTMLNANAGDRIVLLDIYMPDIYQRAAENRLLREATKYLDANDDGDIQYTFTFDKIRLQQIPALARQLREGAIMRIVDNDLQIKTENKTKTIRNNDVPVVYTKSLTYSDVNSAVVEENTYVENRDVEYLKGKGIEQVEITADIDVHHEGERGGHGGQGEVVWTFKSGEFNLVISDEDTKNTLQTIGDNKIKVTLYSESKNAYFERVCIIKERIDSKTYKLVLSEDAFEKSEYTGLGSVYVMYSVLITDSSIVTDVTKKILPYGTNVFCEAIDLIDFQAGKYYEVTIDVEDNGLAAVDSGSQNTLFALVNGLGDGQRWFIPNYTFERVDETKHPFRGFATYDRYTFKFTLGEDFNDNSPYYPAIRFISDGQTEKVSVRLVSIIERDSDSLIDMNYVDLGIETLSINFHDNTRVKPAIPMSYEITATVKEETRASAWVQVMQRIDSTEIVGEQNIRTQETLANMARRHYRELLALKGSIFDPDGTCDQTFLQVMMMQVGADSMNYQLDNTRTGLNKDGLQTIFNCLCANNKFEVGASDRLRHYVYTQGSQGGTWEIAGGVSFDLDGKNTYFVAIKCERDGRNGVWVCDTNQHKVDEEENYWYFNWAIINLVGGEYVLTETRGNAYMYGDNLVCGKISTLAGQSYFDLTHGNFVLSDGIKPSLSYINGVLTISGVNSDDADSILNRLGITEGVASGAQSTADAANAAAKAAQEEAKKAGEEAKEYAKSLTNELGESLQNQIDGVIDSYFMEGVPYGNFRPSSDWGTTEVKNRHLGDTYTNILKNKGNLAELYSNGLPLWIEQGDLFSGGSHIGKTFEQQRASSTTACRAKTIFKNYNGLVIGTPPSGIQMLVVLYDANKIHRNFVLWTTSSITLNNAGTYPYISVVFKKTDGSAITPSELAGITSSELTNPEAGKSWRWCNNDDTDDSTFHWHEIADSDAVLALQKAAEAQDTADEKRRVFVSQPTPPYEVGDLWAQGGASGEDILKCTTARATGSFQQSDWAAASSALSAAADAKQAADNAQATADGLKWSVIKNYGDADIEYFRAMLVKGLNHKIYEVLPSGTYRAQLGSENPGNVSSSDGFSSSSLMIVKSGQSTDTASNILMIVNWDEEFTITENVDIHVLLCQKDYYSSTKRFPYSGTWNLKGIRVLTLTTQSISALDYLKAALTDGSTEIAGGLTMTNVLMLKNLQGVVTAGMSGLTKLPSDSSKSENVLMWGGGTYEDAYNAAESADYYKKGSTTPITTLLKKDGTGKIGVFKISDKQVVVDNGDSKTIITTQTISDYSTENNIGFISYDKEFTSRQNVNHAQVLMSRTFDGSTTGTVNIKSLFCTVGIYGTDSLRSATAKLRVSVVYGTNNTTEIIKEEEIFITSSNSSTNQYIVINNFEKSYSNIKSFKIELLSGSQTNYGSIQISFHAYAGIAGNNNISALAKDGFMISSGSGDRFIIKPKDNNFCVIADIPIVSTKEDVDKLEIGQLFTDSSGIVRRFSYEDASDSTETRKFESIYNLRNNVNKQTLDLSGFRNVNMTESKVQVLTITQRFYATGLPTSYNSTSTDKEVYLYDGGSYYTLRARDNS